MFNALIARLTGAAAAEPELDAQFAVAALLVRIAKADAHYAYEEIAEIDRVLARTWGLNPVEAMKMRATAEAIEARAPDTAEFTGLVQAHTPYLQRAALFDSLWDVSLADRELHEKERRFLDAVAVALGIEPGHAADAARRRGVSP
ncbi:MAG: TerB family tellurite resistance protein [Maritimibacter sp.]|nr:TerB family tellurite resistance protein [Maritimibacter sp.]